MFECVISFIDAPDPVSVYLHQKQLMTTWNLSPLSDDVHLSQSETHQQSRTTTTIILHNGACKLKFSPTFPNLAPCSPSVGFLQSYKSCHSAPQYTVPYRKPSSTLKLLYWGQEIPWVMGCGCTQTPRQADATHNTHTYTVDISWPTSLPACFYVCIFVLCCYAHS